MPPRVDGWKVRANIRGGLLPITACILCCKFAGVPIKVYVIQHSLAYGYLALYRPKAVLWMKLDPLFGSSYGFVNGGALDANECSKGNFTAIVKTEPQIAHRSSHVPAVEIDHGAPQLTSGFDRNSKGLS